MIPGTLTVTVPTCPELAPVEGLTSNYTLSAMLPYIAGDVVGLSCVSDPTVTFITTCQSNGTSLTWTPEPSNLTCPTPGNPSQSYILLLSLH